MDKDHVSKQKIGQGKSDRQEGLRLSNQESNRLTRESLRTALIYLMGEKDFDKITITELVKRAGISRTAFYRNYNTKDDILVEMMEQFIEGLTRSFYQKEYRNNIKKWYLDTFSAVKENAAYVQMLMQADISQSKVFGPGSLLEKIIPSRSVERHYRILALEGAFLTILINWFRDGMKESCEYMAEFCYKTLRLVEKNI